MEIIYTVKMTTNFIIVSRASCSQISIWHDLKTYSNLLKWSSPRTHSAINVFSNYYVLDAEDQVVSKFTIKFTI